MEAMAAVRKPELEYIPYGPYGILNWKCNENEPLENQVKSLKERVRTLEIYLRSFIRDQDFLEGDFFLRGILSTQRIFRGNLTHSSISYGTSLRAGGRRHHLSD
jgi:hypothetical protein